MSSAPSHAPGSTPSASAEPVVEVPEIADVRKGFLRWIWGTISGTAVGLKNAIAALTVRPTAYVFRKIYNGAIWTPNYVYNYAHEQYALLKTTPLWTGLAFGCDTANYRLYGGGGHAHGGGGEAAAH